MIENKSNNDSLIYFDSNDLTKINNSISIVDKIIEEHEDRAYLINWEILFKFKNFFSEFFSTFHPFTETELIELYDKLEVGSPHIELHDDLYIDIKTCFGLIFNEHIEWTDKLQIIYQNKPYLIYPGGSVDVYSYEMRFDDLPLNKLDEFLRVKEIYETRIYNGFYESIDGHLYENEQEKYEDLQNLDLYTENLLNKRNFSNKDIMTIISENKTWFFCNTTFPVILLMKILKDIPDFSIETFYFN